MQSPDSPNLRPLPPGVLLPGALAVAVLAGGIGWGLAHNQNKQSVPQVRLPTNTASAVRSRTPGEVLEAVPIPTGNGAAEREVRRWREAARLAPNNPVVWVNLGDALMQQAREGVDPHNIGPAEQVYQFALFLDPQHAPAMTGLAWVAGNRHQFEDSITWAKKALGRTPQNSSAWGLIGDAQVERGEYDEAFASYQQMLDIKPDLASYSRGAHLLFLTGDTRKALWLMRKAILAGAPSGENTAWCRAQMADMLFASGALFPAEIVVKEGLKYTPGNYHLLVCQGKVRMARGNLAGAAESYRRAADIAPQHAALVGLYDALLALEEREKAGVVLERIEAAAAHHASHGNRDAFYLARFYADHDLKTKQAQAIVQANPDPANPVDCDTAAWVHYRSGNITEAKRLIARALKKGAPDAARLFHAGMIYARVGERERARHLLSRALSRNPHFDRTQARVAAETLHALGMMPPSGNRLALQDRRS